jgi:hypothetical protein
MSARPKADFGAACGRHLQVAGEEVGVEVGFDDGVDDEAAGSGVLEIPRDVALRVDDDRPSGGLVTDQVGGVRQAAEEVLLEDHGDTFEGLESHDRSRGP